MTVLGAAGRPAGYSTQDRVLDSVAAIRERTDVRPRVAMVLGSGLGVLADVVVEAVSIPYAEIPHFPQPTAPGHAGRLVLGVLSGNPVVVMSGRVHLYEGYSAQDVAYPIQVMRTLGAEILVVTNAAGGINLAFPSGALMLISDHINFTGRNPLIGANDPHFGLRFPDMSDAYDPGLRGLARRAAADRSIDLVEGVYVAVLGPSYETPAEIRMFRALGADAVGMSTVMEVISARHMGMRVLGISCITNMAAGILPHRLTEQEVIETAGRVRDEFADLLEGTIRSLRVAPP